MKDKSENKALHRVKGKQTEPIKKREDVPKSNDEHIDQDYPGFPHHPAKEEIINPKTNEQRLIAGVDKTMGK